ncbi:MAG: NUDIX domain-containing protein [Planctomycetota bacterium]
MPEPLVDGNVERVLARLFGLPGAAGSPVLRKAAWSLAADLVPEQGAGAWNQALMELGAGPCSPRTPACGDCPWQRSCHAARSGDPAAIPAPKPRKKPVDLELEGAWIWRDGALCLVQRPADGPMAGLWELPTRRLTDGIGEHLWSAAWPGRLSPRLGGPAWEARHSITHHRIRMRVFPAQAARPAGGTWFTAEELRDLAVTGLTKKALAQLLP